MEREKIRSKMTTVYSGNTSRQGFEMIPSVTSNATGTLWAQVVPDEVEEMQDPHLKLPSSGKNNHRQRWMVRY